MVDLDAFADIHAELMEAGRAARATGVMPRLLLELAARLPLACLVEAIMATQDARGLGGPGDAATRRAALMVRLLPPAGGATQ